jgi:hypothetical protein
LRAPRKSKGSSASRTAGSAIENVTGSLIIELLEAHLAPHWSDFSTLRVRHAGCKVFDIRWNSEGAFKIAKFELGIGSKYCAFDYETSSSDVAF